MTAVAELPGGLWLDGKLERRALFKPVTGELELALAELEHAPHRDHPGKITAILVAALENLGTAVAAPETVARLCVGDRQFLLKELASRLDGKPQWVTASCAACGEAMDLCYRYAELPVKPASSDYPERDLKLGRRALRLRCVTGEDQSAIAAADSDAGALNLLLERLVSGREKPVEAKSLTARQREKIESAVEAMSPEVGDELLAECPQCDARNRVRVELFRQGRHATLGLLGEVHSLAINYHWPESEILKLSRERRQVYLGLIDRSRGMVSERQAEAGP